MAAYNKFQDFVEQLGKGVHDFSTHTIKVFLTNEQPLATDTVKLDMVEIAAGNGYTAGGFSVTPVWSEAGGTAQLAGTDVVVTATGAVGPFQFVVEYNDSTIAPAPVDALISWWDRGSALTLANGDTFTVDFGATIFTLA